MSGEVVRLLSIGYRQPGYYIKKAEAAYWDGHNESGEIVASGVYFYHIRAGAFHATRKMVISK